MPKRLPGFAFLAAVATCWNVSAEPVFDVRNEALLSRTTALPQLGQTSVLDPGGYATHFAVDWSNEYVSEQNSHESLTIDGETQHIDFGLRYGVAPKLEISVQVPVIVTGGGVLDGLIDGWHDTFGLPTGGRKQVGNNEYGVRYTRDGVSKLDVTRGYGNVGDFELGAGYAVRDDLALRAMIKLPSGDEDRLAGGNAGVALWFDFDPFKGSARWFGFISAGGSYNGQSNILGDQQRQFVGYGGIGAGYRIVPAFALMAQFYAHTHLYSGSSLDALDSPGGQLVFGGRIRLAPKLSLDLGVLEDVIVDSSPDFGIHLGLNFH